MADPAPETRKTGPRIAVGLLYALPLLLIAGVLLGVWEYRRGWHQIGNWYALQGVVDMLISYVSEHDAPPRNWAELGSVYEEAGRQSGYTTQRLEELIAVDFDAMQRYFAYGGPDVDFLRFNDPPGNEEELQEANARLRDLLERSR